MYDVDRIDIRRMTEREFLTLTLWLLGGQEVEEYRRVPVTRTLHLDLVLTEDPGGH